MPLGCWRLLEFAPDGVLKHVSLSSLTIVAGRVLLLFLSFYDILSQWQRMKKKVQQESSDSDSEEVDSDEEVSLKFCFTGYGFGFVWWLTWFVSV